MGIVGGKGWHVLCYGRDRPVRPVHHCLGSPTQVVEAEQTRHVWLFRRLHEPDRCIRLLGFALHHQPI